MRQEQNRTKYDTLREGKSPPIKNGQGNTIGVKKPQEQANESKRHLPPLLGVPQKHQASIHNS